MARSDEPEASAAPSPAEIARLPYRPCVGLMLINREGRVFVARRRDMPSEAWQMPQGGIRPGEAPRAAALRELAEETGTDRAEIVDEMDGWLAYDLPPALVPRLWGGRYRGQTQRWFALAFTGTEADIDIHRHDEPEFLEWRWADLEELPRLIVPFKRAVYARVAEAFRPTVEEVKRRGGPAASS